MFWPETDVAVFVFSLMVVAERIASSFGRLLVEPATRKYSPCRFNPHHRRTSASVLYRISTFKTGLNPVVDVTFARDVVVSHTIMRQVNDRVLPAATSQLGSVKPQWLPNALDVIEY
jgi:hypothetical protein